MIFTNLTFRENIMFEKLVAVGLIVVGVSAFAAPQKIYTAKKGITPYVGVVIGGGTHNTGGSSLRDEDKIKNASSGLVYQLNGGVAFNKYLAAEVFYGSNGNHKVNLETAHSLKSAFTSYGVDVKGMLPIENSLFILFGKLGLANVVVKTACSG
jgi:hypothetical protein